MKKILVLNSGSSSLKFHLFDGDKSLAYGNIEKIGCEKSFGIFCFKDECIQHKKTIKNHNEAILMMAKFFKDSEILLGFDELLACGHRVVHGGDRFFKSCVVTEKVIEQIKDAIELAPLHNKANLDGILIMKELAPKVKNIVVFDTAFHQSMPDFVYTYAINRALAIKHRIRKYGFHGTSYKYVSALGANYLKKDLNDFNAIVFHLGNGASACAIKGGKSFETSMGFSPLEGLIMGTRCGDIDPAALFYLAHKEGFGYQELDEVCNKKSGLVSICGYNDMRDINELKDANSDAMLAYEMFIHRIRKYLGAYVAILGRIDAVIFTAGIGQNDKDTRAAVMENLEHIGLEFDKNKNEKCSPAEQIVDLSKDGSKIKILKINTNEELAIAQECLAFLK